MIAFYKRVPWEWLLIPLLTTVGQALMKVLAVQMLPVPMGILWVEQIAKSPLTLAVLAGEIISFLLWMRILAVTDVSRAVPLTAISYIFIILTGWLFFNEPILKLELLGGGFILGGVAVLRTA